MTQQTDSVPAGWYPDPEDAGRLRWWDGQEWGPVAPPAKRNKSVGSNGPGVASLVLGIIAFSVSLFTFRGVFAVMAIVGLLIGILGAYRSKDMPSVSSAAWIAGVALNGLVIAGFLATALD